MTALSIFSAKTCKILCLFLGLTYSLSLVSRSYAQPKTKPLAEGVLKVCSDAGFLPFEMKDSEGKWEGFDIDMMNDFAKSLKAKLVMVQINFDGIIPALISGKCDMIAAGMTVTPNRKKVVAFSSPTFVNGLSIALKNTLPNVGKYKNLQSLDEVGIKIAVKTGYTSDIYLTKNLKKAQILRFDQDSDLFLAIMQGRANAFVGDTTYVSLIAKENPNKLKIISTPVTSEEFSVATRLQNKELMEKFNKFLEKWRASGSYAKVYNKYFKG